MGELFQGAWIYLLPVAAAGVGAVVAIFLPVDVASEDALPLSRGSGPIGDLTPRGFSTGSGGDVGPIEWEPPLHESFMPNGSDRRWFRVKVDPLSVRAAGGPRFLVTFGDVTLAPRFGKYADALAYMQRLDAYSGIEEILPRTHVAERAFEDRAVARPYRPAIRAESLRDPSR
jgi:hypothetical protein